MKYKNNLKIILIAAITLIFISGCSFFNKGEQASNTQNKSNQVGNISEEEPDLKGNVLNISGDEITIAKIRVKGGGNVSSPKVGAKVDSKDMGKFKFNTNTKIIVRNSYGNEGTGKGGRTEDKTGVKDDIKTGSFVEVWTEKGEESEAKTVRITIFNKQNKKGVK